MILRLLLVFACFSSAVQATTVVRFVDATGIRQNPNNQYFIHLLDAALAATEAEYGAYQLMPVDIEIIQGRQFIELQKGTFDLFWTMTTPGREQDALAVQQPLIKGAYGIRLLVVQHADIAKMAQITSLPELAKLVALSGADWPDSAILRFNWLTVETNIADGKLYQTLQQKPGYYFPRGLLEAGPELAAADKAQLSIVRHIVIRYPATMKFFVAKQNSALAQRLTAGLEILKQNGRFDDIFYQFAPHAAVLSQLQLQGARLLELNSPFIMSAADAQGVTAEQDALLAKLGVGPAVDSK